MNDSNMSGEKSREQLPDRFKWNLSDLYESIEDWKEKKEKISEEIKKLPFIRDNFVSSGLKLYEGLSFYSTLEKEFMRLYAYASMLSDQDTKESNPMSMKQEMIPLQTQLKSLSSFIEPEVLTLSNDDIDKFYSETPQLKIYKQYISDILRRKNHTLNESEEELIAQAGLMAGTSHEIYNIFTNADLPYPEVELSDGKKIHLDPTNYSLYRESKNRDDRKIVFYSFFETLENFQRSFGTQTIWRVEKESFL